MIDRRLPSREGRIPGDRELAPQSYVPLLVLDLDGVAASELTDTLRQRGFNAAFATNCREAHAAISTSGSRFCSNALLGGIDISRGK